MGTEIWNQRHAFIPIEPGAMPTGGRGRRFIDLTGKRFGKLTIVSLAGKQGNIYKWHCECDCGGSSVYFGNKLNAGRHSHCGCESAKTSIRFGAHASDSTFRAWREMLACCYRSSHRSYKHIGANGIRPCHEWRESFLAFRDAMGERPKGCRLARKNERLGFSPDNCFWAKQGDAILPHSTRYEFDGRSLTLRQWAKELGISRQRIYQRLKRMPFELALSYGKCANASQSPNYKPRQKKEWPKTQRAKRQSLSRPERLTREERRIRRAQMRVMNCEGYSIQKIALWFGVIEQTVRLALKEQGNGS